MIIRLLMVLVTIAIATPSYGREVVTVGGYSFAPYVEFDTRGTPSGIAIDLIEAMNRHQQDYEFRFVATSPSRRYKDFEEHKFDLILFESPDWEWTGRHLPVEASTVLLRGGDLYIAQAAPGRDQGYFDDFSGKHIVGILGYHFAFAGFASDPKELTAKFNMTLVTDNGNSIAMILKGRADIAMVTDAYLFHYLKANPDAAPKLLVSERYDQRNDLPILVRRGGKIGLDQVNGLIAALQADGTLSDLWAAYGLNR